MLNRFLSDIPFLSSRDRHDLIVRIVREIRTRFSRPFSSAIFPFHAATSESSPHSFPVLCFHCFYYLTYQ